jgi:hypothetical protein
VNFALAVKEVLLVRSYSLREIEDISDTHVRLIQKIVVQQSVVDVIVEAYDRFINGDEAQRLGIERAKNDQDTRLRLTFEVLCFAAFLSRAPAADFFTELRWFKKKPNVELLTLYYTELSRALHSFCEREGLHKLREIVVVSIKPEIKFGLGDLLDAKRRYSEYQAGQLRELGSELEFFGKNIGKALDPKHYPILELIGGVCGKPLLELAAMVTKQAFLLNTRAGG